MSKHHELEVVDVSKSDEAECLELESVPVSKSDEVYTDCYSCADEFHPQAQSSTDMPAASSADAADSKNAPDD